MFSLAYPWLLVLLPVPWLVRYGLPPKHVRRIAVRVPFGDRLRQSIGDDYAPTVEQGTRVEVMWQLGIWFLVVITLARPQWIEPPISKEIPTRDLLLLVDLSGSMQQEDFVNAAGQPVDRLSAVKEVLGGFLQRREGDRVGLVVFGDAAYLQAPFSTDLSLCRRLLDECEIGMAGPRTSLGDAIGLGVNLFEESNTPAKTIVALTDGNDTKSRVPPIEAARVAAQRDIRIYAVAIGDPTTVGEDKLDEQALRDVASATGGAYYFAADRTSLEDIYDELDRLETRQVKTEQHRPRRDVFYLFLAIALLMALTQKMVVTWQLRRDNVPVKRSIDVRVDAFTGNLELVEDE